MGGRRIAGWVCALACLALGFAGCASPPAPEPEARAARPRGLERRTARDAVIPASHVEPAALVGPVAVDDLVAIAVARNPRLSKAAFAIDAAQGRHIQAGLYPNPDLAINSDEIGDRTGHGVLNIPKLTQTIVTGKKLSLAQAVAATEVDQATLALLGERYAVIAAVRAAYFDLYALERKIEVLDRLVKLGDESVKTGKAFLDNKKLSQLDLVQLEVEREKFHAEAEAARREVPGARRALAAIVGDSRLAIGELRAAFEDLPVYDPARTHDVVLATNPEARKAQVGVERAHAAIRRAQAEVIPDVTVYTGYIRQYENKAHDLQLGMNAPIPVWNRNQGNIRAAQAELGAAVQDVARVENELAERVATALRVYSGAARRAELYRVDILPKAKQAAELSLQAFKGGQFDYLRVLQAQRAVAEAALEYNKSLGEAWKAAAQLSGLLLEEIWPGAPALPTPPIDKPGP